VPEKLRFPLLLMLRLAAPGETGERHGVKPSTTRSPTIGSGMTTGAPSGLGAQPLLAEKAIAASGKGRGAPAPSRREAPVAS